MEEEAEDIESLNLLKKLRNLGVPPVDPTPITGEMDAFHGQT